MTRTVARIENKGIYRVIYDDMRWMKHYVVYYEFHTYDGKAHKHKLAECLSLADALGYIQGNLILGCVD